MDESYFKNKVTKEFKLLQTDGSRLLKAHDMAYDQRTSSYVIITDFYKHGNLETYFKNLELSPFENKHFIRYVFYELIMILRQMRNNQIIHRDIKS